MRDRFLCIHGHFYQPPRENPWLEEVEEQDSAAPFHDWNGRITAECYGPNAAARLLTEHRRITDVVNNYRSISFNFGPTLLSWMERAAPNVYRSILEADLASRQRRNGHGNAIAQAYHHAILPLCSRRDKRTEVRWGIADFEHRFGRKPEGMWLPETAADIETLEVLAEEGIRFTILSPYQAVQVRRRDREEWTDVDGGQIDPTRPYWVLLPNDRRIAVFFYDGPIAKALAFENGLDSTEALLSRLESGYDASRRHVQLLSVAVDGETFGHHRKGGDEVLAGAIRLAEQRGLQLTNFGAFLAEFSPTHVVRIREPSSWSCAHGVERWRSDCGCTTSAYPGWHQRWRAPLREAFEWLRDAIDAFYEAEGARLLRDPWEARDDYVHVVLDRSPERVNAFLARHERARGLLFEPENKVQVLRLLEAQRNRLMMFTSCGWFFGEISSIETTQVLRYAARALQLVEEAGGPVLEPRFVAALAKAPSNLPEVRDGRGVWERFIRPSIVSLPGILAHQAIVSLSRGDEPETEGRLFCYRYRRLAHRMESAGPATLAMGRTVLTSENTLATLDGVYAVLHFGGNDFRCSVRPYTDAQSYKAIEDDLFEPLARFDLTGVVRALDRHFVGQDFGLRNLFLDERRALAKSLLREARARWAQDYRRIYEENLGLLRFLQETNIPIPIELLAACELSLTSDVAALVDGLWEGTTSARAARLGIEQTLEEARRFGIELSMKRPKRVVERLIRRQMRALFEAPRPELAEELIELVNLGEVLGPGLDLWEAQNLFWELCADPPRTLAAPLLLRLGEKLWFHRDTLAQKLEAPAWEPVPSSLS
ncbi:MAG TPA: DUF3536 domain-containing protein [Fredinandcohnia sp.]|nr:DUF3536 domain-containing protein [Fredinandcohnia sp.]